MVPAACLYLRMKYLFLTIVVLCAGQFGRAQTAQSAKKFTATWETERYWSEINNLDGRFQLLSPEEFTYRVDSLETGLGQQALAYLSF